MTPIPVQKMAGFVLQVRGLTDSGISNELGAPLMCILLASGPSF